MAEVFVLFGADSKTGVTMLCTDLAAAFAACFQKEKKVLHAALHDKSGRDFRAGPALRMEDVFLRLGNGLRFEKDLFLTDGGFENLFALAGPSNEAEERIYTPSMVANLMRFFADDFTAMVSDAGSRLDNGLAVGALCAPQAKKVLVFTPNEICLDRAERKLKLCQSLDIRFDVYVLNRCSKRATYGAAYVRDRLGLRSEKFFCVAESGRGQEAEMEREPLSSLDEGAYAKDLRRLRDFLLESAGLGPEKKAGSKLWKSFH